jgi:hypothetical protein
MALIEKLKNIANAIRSKTNKNEELTLEQMASEVEGIDTLQGIDLSPLGNSEELTRLNMEWINNEVQRTLEKAKTWSNISQNTTVAGQGFWTDFSGAAGYKVKPYIFYTKLDGSRLTNLLPLFSGNSKIQYINVDDAVYNAKFTTLQGAFSGTNMYCWLRGVDFGTQNDYSNVTSCHGIFNNAVCNEFIRWGNLKYCEKITTWQYAFNNCREIPYVIDFEFAPFVRNATNFDGMFYFGGGTFNGSAKRIKGLDIINGTTFGRFLGYRSITECVELKNWKQGNFDFTQQQTTNIIKTMKYMIFHAVDSDDGAVNRSMTLHATPKNEWLNEVANTKPTQDDCYILGVEDYDRYGDLTWEEIASTIKDITIA